MTNVHHLDDLRRRREAYEQQRKVAAEAMHRAAAEFRKLEQFADQGRRK